jgi:hypothetical protein
MPAGVIAGTIWCGTLEQPQENMMMALLGMIASIAGALIAYIVMTRFSDEPDTMPNQWWADHITAVAHSSPNNW